MDDVELFKVILNGGSFALIVVFTLWVLFRAAPALNATIERINMDNAAAHRATSADHRTTIDALATAHRAAVDTIAREFREAIIALQKECREERAELLKRCDESERADREAREKQGEAFQATLAEVHNYYREKRP